MRRLVTIVIGFGCVLLLPSLAFAQATITGTVHDSSGAVIPGVTVEASGGLGETETGGPVMNIVPDRAAMRFAAPRS